MQAIRINEVFWIFVKVVFSIVVFAIFLQTVPAVKAASAELTKIAFYEKRAVTIGESSLVVKIADTDKRRKKGLSESDPLAHDEGMLFVFDMIANHGIWMKDMNYPIDIIWLDENAQVIHIEAQVSPDTYPTVFHAPKVSRYVLEVKSGYVRSEGIRKGDYLMIF